jgi:transcriptional regulator with XRE-family HTH domain
MARELGISQTTMSDIETGNTTLTRETIDRLASVLALPENGHAELVDQLAQLQTEINTVRVLHRRGQRWNQDRLGALETSASVIRVYQQAVVPGLLQTPEYARSMLSLWDPNLQGVEQLIAGRIERQGVLYDRSKRFHLLLNEGALRARLAPPPVLRGQLDRIVTLASGLDHIEIGVVPAEAPAFAMTSFDILDDVASVETDASEIVVRDPREVARYIDLFEALRRCSLRGQDMVRLIRGIEQGLAGDAGAIA